MIHVRPASAADRPFIVSGWSSSYRMSRDETTPMPIYAKQKHEEVNFYLDRCSTLVAHGELGVLMGFIAFDPSTYVERVRGRRMTLDGYVLYIYVAGIFRRRGIAKRLFAAAGISPSQQFGYACRTQWSWDLRAKIPKAEHEPRRARFEETTHGRDADSERQAGEREAGDETGGEAKRAHEDPGDSDLAP